MICAILTLAASLAADSTVYVGTRNRDGIYRFRYNSASHTIHEVQLAGRTVDPTFLVLHPTRPWLYSVVAQPAGKVSAFHIEAGGELRLLNEVSSKGAGPAHVQLDRSGRWVVASNYGSGSMAVFQILPDGKLSDAVDWRQHTGAAQTPHAHFAIFTPDNRTLLVNDLGLDQVKRYQFNEVTGKLTELAPLVTPKGSGPRHLALGKKRIYVLNELASSVSVFEGLTLRQTVSALPAGFTGKSSAAEILLDRQEKFLYTSNRGADTIAVFRLGKQLEKIADVKVGGIPRNFVFTPDGSHMLVGSQTEETVSVFEVNPKTGMLTPVGAAVSVPFPICLRFRPPGQIR